MEGLIIAGKSKVGRPVRGITPFLGLIISVSLLLLTSCEVGEMPSRGSVERTGPRTQEAKERVGEAKLTPSADKVDRGITLNPPYIEFYGGDRPWADRLSVVNAVRAITDQAGVRYDQRKSFHNTYPMCTEWVFPDFENKPWQEALEELLAPFNFTYVMENDTLVLVKAGEIEQREEALRVIAARVASLVDSEIRPRKIPDPAIVFPLLNKDGVTTELGTLLSELGMLKATYIPRKAFNIHVPSLIVPCHQGSELGFEEPGWPIPLRDWQRIKARFDAGSSATGTLEIASDGSFRVVLNFEGEKGVKEFSIDGTSADLVDIPGWIARCVHEYCGAGLSPAQENYVNTPELRSTSDLFALLELEAQYRAGKKNSAQWRRFLKRNPCCAFALYRYHLLSGNQEHDDSLEYISAALRKLGSHQLLKFLQADWYHRAEEYEKSVPRFLELLEDDFRNDALYSKLDEGLLGLGQGGNAALLHTFWTSNDPDFYAPLLAGGIFYIKYAWDARGHGWASTVTEENWRKFRERLEIAEPLLEEAYKLNPSDPRASVKLMVVARGLRYDREYLEKWFEKAVEGNPRYYDAYQEKLTYLMPKWYGNRREMFAFVRACAANPPECSRVAMTMVDAHYEMARRSADEGGNWRDYYQDPEVWKELEPVYQKYLHEHPDSMGDRNCYAKYAFYARDYLEAARQFKHIGSDIEKSCWGSERYFYKCRSTAYRHARVDPSR